MILFSLLAALVLLPERADAQRDPAACPAPDTAGLLIRFLDIDQGDAALVRTSDGRLVLIDGGPSESLLDAYLSRYRVGQLDLVVASHNHADHIGGLPAAIQRIPVVNVLENGMPATSRIYGRFVDAVARRGSRVLRPDARTLTIGSASLQVLPPWSGAREQNDASIGLVLRYGAFAALFTGDAEEGALDAWTGGGAIPRVAVVKVGHHGSRNATTEALVRAASPTLAVISVGEGNTYHHPHPEALRRWAAPSRRIARTDRDGTVSVRGCRDGRFFVRTAREETP